MANSGYSYVVSTGAIVPDTSDLLTEVQNEYKDVFGQDLNVSSSTPQGMLINAEVISRKSVINNNVVLANQINPNFAGGVFLDALMSLTGTQRAAPVFSVCKTCGLSGIPGTVIPANSQIKDIVFGNIFESVSSITLAIDGTGSVDFQATLPGPLAATAGTLTIILNGGVLGWETVTNPTDAVLGTNTQSDQASKQLRRSTIAIQGTALTIAVISGLYATPNVKSLTFRENISNSTQVIDGITMVGHSIYTCVNGGLDTDIANTLTNKKSLGSAYNGSTSVNVLVPISGQTIDVLFDRPILVPILARVTVSQNTAIQDVTDAVIKAILDYANGNLIDEPGLIVGQNVSCFEFAGAINQEIPGVYIKNLEITLASSISYSNAEIPIAINKMATIQSSSISVVIV